MPDTQELDVYRSDDLEEVVEKRGFHISPIGSLIVTISLMLLIPIALHPQRTSTLDIMLWLFIIGFVARMGSHVETLFSFETVKDSVLWGIGFGGIIAVVEVFIAGAMIDYRTAIAIDDTTMILIVISVGAVAEELLYRGGLQTFIREYFVAAGLPSSASVAIAVVTGAALFSLGHMFVYNTWNLFASLFVGGIMFGAIYEYKKDLTVPILAHLILNLSSMKDVLVGWAMTNWLLFVLLAIITVAFLFIRRV